MTTGNSYFASSGASPPVDFSGAPPLPSGSSPPDSEPTPPPLPPELVEALAGLLAEAIVADIRQFPNLAELCANQESTVESPWGHDRTDLPARRRARQDPRTADRRPAA